MEKQTTGTARKRNIQLLFGHSGSWPRRPVPCRQKAVLLPPKRMPEMPFFEQSDFMGCGFQGPGPTVASARRVRVCVLFKFKWWLTPFLFLAPCPLSPTNAPAPAPALATALAPQLRAHRNSTRNLCTRLLLLMFASVSMCQWVYLRASGCVVGARAGAVCPAEAIFHPPLRFPPPTWNVSGYPVLQDSENT